MDTEHVESLWGRGPLIDIAELVAAYLGVPLSTIYGWRVNGKGPRAPDR